MGAKYGNQLKALEALRSGKYYLVVNGQDIDVFRKDDPNPKKLDYTRGYAKVSLSSSRKSKPNLPVHVLYILDQRLKELQEGQDIKEAAYDEKLFEVDHEDGILTNNSPDNLKLKDVFSNQSNKKPRLKLTSQQVEAIKFIHFNFPDLHIPALAASIRRPKGEVTELIHSLGRYKPEAEEQ